MTHDPPKTDEIAPIRAPITPSPGRQPWALLLTVLVIYGFICAPLLSGKVYAEYDLREQFIPWRVFYSLALEKNELGIWNPFMFRGYDHHGEGQSGVLHPVHLLIYKFLPITVSISLELFFYIPFAIIGMMIFLSRSLKLSRTASVFGAGVFGLSVFFYAHFPHINMLWIYSHLPWATFAVERCFRSANRGRYASFLSVIYASMILLGHPQMVWMNTLVIFIVIVYLMVQPESERLQGYSPRVIRGDGLPTQARISGNPDRSCEDDSESILQEIPSDNSPPHTGPRQSVNNYSLGLILPGSALLIGCLIGMIQLLPSLEYFLQSTRNDFTTLMSGNFSLHPLNLLINLSPYLFIDKSVGDFFYEGPGNFHFLNSHQELPAYLGVVILTLIYVGTVIYRKEIFNRLNRRALTFFFCALLTSILLTLGKYGGINYLLDIIPIISKFRCPARYICIVIFLISVAAAIIVNFFESRKPSLSLTKFHAFMLSAPMIVGVLLMIGAACSDYIPFRDTRLYIDAPRYLAVGPVFMLITYICCFLICSGRRWALTLVCMICLIDVAAYAIPILQRSELRTFDQIKAVRLKMIDRDHSYRHVSKLNEPLWDGSYLANGYLGISPRDDLDLFGNRDHLRLASVRYAHGTTDTFVIDDALPRIRLVPNLKHAIDPLNNLDEIDLNYSVLCAPHDAAEITGPPIHATENVELISDDFEELRVRVKVDVPRILVISDRWSKYWRASVDGEERKVIPLFDSHMQGIIVGRSDKEVTLRYRSETIAWGAMCALVGVILTTFLFVKR